MKEDGTMRIGICDDEETARTAVKTSCLKYGLAEEDIFLFSHGKEVLDHPGGIDLLFLDIEMPGLSGLEVKEFLEYGHSPFFIVFCTSHVEAMPEAFGKNVIGFLQKPPMYLAVVNYIQKVENIQYMHHSITLDDDRTKVYSDDVVYMECNKRMGIVVCKGAKSHATSFPLNYWNEQLHDYGFFQTDRSHLINLKYAENTIEL